MRKILIGFLGCFIFFAILGCQAPELKNFSVNTFQNGPRVGVNVSDIQIKSETTKYDRLPHIENKMPITPEKALKDWIRNRFYAGNPSTSTIAVVTVQKAYMTQTDDPQETWYVYNNVNYRLTYALSVDFMKDGDVIHHQNLEGFETVSIPKRSSLAEKEAAWQKMMNAMIQKVDNQVFSKIPSEFKAR